jgi:hypothetical protein
MLLSVLALLIIALPLGAAFAQDDEEGAMAGAGLSLVCAVIGLIINIIILSWVYKDANRRGANGCLWAILVFFTGLIGLILYILLRPKA